MSMKPHTKAAATTAVRWAGGLSAGFVVWPIMIGFSTGTADMGKLIAEKLMVGFFWLPILFLVFWAWGTFTKKDPVTGAELDPHLSVNPSINPSNKPDSNVGAIQSPQQSMQSGAENFYDAVVAELGAGGKDESLWNKAFVSADGDENKAKARYIHRRAEVLSQQAFEIAAPITLKKNIVWGPKLQVIVGICLVLAVFAYFQSIRQDKVLLDKAIAIEKVVSAGETRNMYDDYDDILYGKENWTSLKVNLDSTEVLKLLGKPAVEYFPTAGTGDPKVYMIWAYDQAKLGPDGFIYFDSSMKVIKWGVLLGK